MSTVTNAQIVQRVELLEKQLALLLANHSNASEVVVEDKPTKKTKVAKVVKSAKKDSSSDDEKLKKKRTSGYIIFSKAMREDAIAKLSADGATYKNQDVMTELGAMWKALGDEEKEEWKSKVVSSDPENSE
jgi:hypothetical protein